MSNYIECPDHFNCQQQHHNHDHQHDHQHSHDYEHNHNLGNEHEHSHNHQHHHSTTSELKPLAHIVETADGLRVSMRILEMDCPTEESLIRQQLQKMPEVQHLEFNLIQRLLIVEMTKGSLDKVIAAIKKLGFNPQLNIDAAAVPSSTKRSYIQVGVALLLAALAEGAEWLGLSVWLIALLAISAILIVGLKTYKKGWLAIRYGKLNINALMSIAVTGALLIGIWPEAAMVMVLFTIAELIEAKSLDRVRNAIAGLMQLTTESAQVLQDDGHFHSTDVKDISIGSIIRVKPGERISLDGVLQTGVTTINQAPITGESMPIEKKVGDQIFAGTINQAGSFTYKVSAIAQNSTIARIIHAVENAQSKKADSQRFIDHFAKIYTPTVVVCALLIAVLMPVIFQASWYDSIYKALVLLVIACPCALVISTPVTIVSGIARAAKLGILIKGGTYLEKGQQIKAIALDKTGTITEGKAQLSDYAVFSANKDEVLAIAHSIARHSDHPVSQAIAQAKLSDTIVKIDDFKALIGQGTASLINGQNYYLGNHRLVHTIDCCSTELEEKLYKLENQGKTVVLLIENNQVIALFAVADAIKKSSKVAINKLKQLGIKTIMLTGDNHITAQCIAKQANIDEQYAEQLPEDKLNFIDKLSQTQVTAMVGDGINDAPALARADIGFAMGAIGSDSALETADVTLMDDDLNKITSFIHLSKKTRQILIENISLALGIKIIFVILTFINITGMWMAVFADVGASLLVIANGLRLLNTKIAS